MEKRRVRKRRTRKRSRSSQKATSRGRRGRQGGPVLMIAVAMAAIGFGLALFGSAFSSRRYPAQGTATQGRLKSMPPPTGTTAFSSPPSESWFPESSSISEPPSRTDLDMDLDVTTASPEILLEEPLTSSDWFEMREQPDL